MRGYGARLALYLSDVVRNELPLEPITQALGAHDQHLVDQINAYAAKRYDQAQEMEVDGYGQMLSVANTLVAAIQRTVKPQLPVGGSQTGGGGTARAPAMTSRGAGWLPASPRWRWWPAARRPAPGAPTRAAPRRPPPRPGNDRQRRRRRSRLPLDPRLPGHSGPGPDRDPRGSTLPAPWTGSAGRRTRPSRSRADGRWRAGTPSEPAPATRGRRSSSATSTPSAARRCSSGSASFAVVTHRRHPGRRLVGAVRRGPDRAVRQATVPDRRRLLPDTDSGTTAGDLWRRVRRHRRSLPLQRHRLRHAETVTLRQLRAPAGRTGPPPAGRRPAPGRTGPTPLAPTFWDAASFSSTSPTDSPRLAGSFRTLSCSPSAPRSLTALASIAFARSTAVLHAAVATGAADALVAPGFRPEDTVPAALVPPPRPVIGPGRRADHHAADQRHDDQQPGDQQPGQRRPPSPSRPGRGIQRFPEETKLSGRFPLTVGPDHVTPQSLELLIVGVFML